MSANYNVHVSMCVYAKAVKCERESKTCHATANQVRDPE